MFILRKILGDSVEVNTELGESFSMTDQRKSPEDFSNLLKKSEVVDSNKDKVYAFVGNEFSNKFIPLFKQNAHYIMSDNGKTFANLSYK